jgi:hypothetical protein
LKAYGGWKFPEVNACSRCRPATVPCHDSIDATLRLSVNHTLCDEGGELQPVCLDVQLSLAPSSVPLLKLTVEQKWGYDPAQVVT